jgi:heme-degrading monooxygenase HmoA
MEDIVMIMTILEGRVSEENWPALEQAFAEASQEDTPGMVRSYLIHGVKEREMWRILTIWRSRQALEDMRKTTETPRGVLIFRSAHAEPQLSIFDVVQEINKE